MLITPGYYLDPCNDHAFRRVFGDPRREPVLRHLLNSVLKLSGEEAIQQLRIADPRQTPKHPDLKDTILDVDCRDQRDHEFIVEMQLANEHDFDKRALFYTAKAYLRKLPKAGDYKDLRKVTLLSVLNFRFLESSKYLSTHLILDKDTGEHRLKDFEYAFLELPKFTLQAQQLRHQRERWAYFFKHAHRIALRDIPKALRVPEIEEAFGVLEEMARNDLERKLYEKAEMDRMDRTAQIETGYDEGHKKGREEGKKEGLQEGEKKGLEKGLEEGKQQGLQEGKQQGLQEGKQQGLQEGKQQGLQEGKKEGKLETARRMLSEGLDQHMIARMTGLSLEEIQKQKEHGRS